MELNTLLLTEYKTRETVIAFDPSYILKSGKHTAGVDYFWSGYAGSIKWGLEIGGLAFVDLKMNTAFHLEAFQTFRKKGEGLLDFYADGIVGRVDHLLEFSQNIVADAYFSKRLFVDKLIDNKLHLTSRLRRDAALRYLYTGAKRKGPGRPKEFDGPIDYANIDKSKMEIVEDNDLIRIYSAKVNAKALKRTIRVVIIYRFDKNKWTHKSYFSTLQ